MIVVLRRIFPPRRQARFSSSDHRTSSIAMHQSTRGSFMGSVHNPVCKPATQIGVQNKRVSIAGNEKGPLPGALSAFIRRYEAP
jgi:hypothetical protein